MGKKYAVDVDGDILVWKDGKFECENKERLEMIDRALERAKKCGITVMLEGSPLYSYYKGQKWIDPTSSWPMSYAFLQTITGGRMKFVSGDKPTWKGLGFEFDPKAIY